MGEKIEKGTGCSKGMNGAMGSRLEVEVRGSGMLDDQRDESKSQRERKLELVRCAPEEEGREDEEGNCRERIKGIRIGVGGQTDQTRQR